MKIPEGNWVEAPGIEPMKEFAEKPKRDAHMGSNAADSEENAPPVLFRPVPSRTAWRCRVSGNRGNHGSAPGYEPGAP